MNNTAVHCTTSQKKIGVKRIVFVLKRPVIIQTKVFKNPSITIEVSNLRAKKNMKMLEYLKFYVFFHMFFIFSTKYFNSLKSKIFFHFFCFMFFFHHKGDQRQCHLFVICMNPSSYSTHQLTHAKSRLLDATNLIIFLQLIMFLKLS